MEYQIKNKLADSLDVILNYLKDGVNFTQEQAPLVCQELLKFDLIHHSVLSGIWLAAYLIATLF